ncbi:receptor-like protein EIX1 [Pyrus communis]|uniref:receptor-like protein EIX1 n=1 Tax=Pyrus communis TaxID=23211 RepID=UPI0035C0BE3E
MDRPLRLVLLVSFLSIAATPISLGNANVGLQVPCKENERQALLMFKQGLVNSSNRLSSWIGEGDCCFWPGVVCSNLTGHVRALHLGNYYLGGKLNPSLLNLSHLTYLDLSSNDFEGMQIPNFFGSLTSLRHLDLSQSDFQGIIPHQLGNLSNLRFLDVHGNYFEVKSLQWISGLPQLQHLDMSGVDLREASDLFQVTNTFPSLLEYLNMSDCGLYQIPFGIANASVLKVLNLEGNSINSPIPKWLYSLSHLESLFLSYNHLHGQISSSIANLTDIVNLDLFHNQLEGELPTSMGSLCKLMVFDLSRNRVNGRVSEIFESLSRCNSSQLESLSLSNNNLSGLLPDELGNFEKLRFLDLSSNSISGSIPMSLGNLSCLEELRIQNNSFKGVVSEVHFTNLTKLVKLYAKNNLLKLETSRDWHPPFQLRVLFLDSWYLGPELPLWFQRQTQLQYLSMVNTSISGTIPTWFWNFSSHLRFVDLSHNQLYGEVPNIVGAPLDIIDLSSNQFNGSLPLVSSTVDVLDLSNSTFSGSIFHFFCDSIDGPKQLRILYLENNFLDGPIPDCWQNWKKLIVLNLENNNLTGNIPSSIGYLLFLESLHLRNNHLFGELPMSLQNCQNLLVADLGENKFVGSIPMWIGESLSNLIVLILRSNKLQSDIPNEICSLVNLQILDLAHNNLSGTIPKCVNNFSAMATLSNSGGPISFFSYMYGSPEQYMEEAILVTKGRTDRYNKFLSLVANLDLSHNMISGEIPEELTSLISLQSLNISKNLLTGKIPSMIGDMVMLESLDLSMNKLSGEISPSMSRLTYLGTLNLSYNNLTGQIPQCTQLGGFDQYSYIGNELCGFPLNVSCKENRTMQPVVVQNHMGGHLLEDSWFCLSLGLGFLFGFWGVLGSLLLNMPWSFRFSQFQNSIVRRLYGVIVEYCC